MTRHSFVCLSVGTVAPTHTSDTLPLSLCLLFMESKTSVVALLIRASFLSPYMLAYAARTTRVICRAPTTAHAIWLSIGHQLIKASRHSIESRPGSSFIRHRAPSSASHATQPPDEPLKTHACRLQCCSSLAKTRTTFSLQLNSISLRCDLLRPKQYRSARRGKQKGGIASTSSPAIDSHPLVLAKNKHRFGQSRYWTLESGARIQWL